MNEKIKTQIGTMTVREAFNMLTYTPYTFIGFDRSMLESYLNREKDAKK